MKRVSFTEHALYQLVERNLNQLNIMKFHYDKKVDTLYIRFNDNRYKESDEVRDGIIIDYDGKGKIIGLEVLDASRQFPSRFRSDLLKRKLPLSLVIEPSRV